MNDATSKASSGACARRRAPMLSVWAGWMTVQNLSRDVNRLWRNVLLGSVEAAGPTWLPELDISEQPDEILIRVDLPGVEAEHLQVQLDHCAIVVSGKRPEASHNTRGFRRYERRFGSFRRRIPLPGGADLDAARATMRNGVLEIHVPIPRRVLPRHLQIDVICVEQSVTALLQDAPPRIGR